jgi:aldose sugar dehydrogenase
MTCLPIKITSPVSDWALGPRTLRLAAIRWLALACLLAQPLPTAAQTAGPELQTADYRYQLETLTDKLDVPWSIVFLPDGRYVVTEREGRLRVVLADGTVQPPVDGVPATFAQGQGGFLGLALHPQFAANGWIYLAYSHPSPRLIGRTTAFTRIVRGRLVDNRWVDEQQIFQVDESFYTSGRLHFGCRMVFDNDGFLFFGIGDRGDMANAQNLAHPAGKIHRLHDDGRVPADNPFVGRADAYPSVWAWGIRNPQGLVFDPVNGLLWETEHGPRGGDELNLIERGGNYGWPTVSYGIHYNNRILTDKQTAPGMEQPAHYWKPSLALCGLALFNGPDFPWWHGSLITGSLVAQEVRRIHVDRGRVLFQETIVKDQGRVRDVAVSPAGRIYLLLENPGRIVRLRYIGESFNR